MKKTFSVKIDCLDSNTVLSSYDNELNFRSYMYCRGKFDKLGKFDKFDKFKISFRL